MLCLSSHLWSLPGPEQQGGAVEGGALWPVALSNVRVQSLYQALASDDKARAARGWSRSPSRAGPHPAEPILNLGQPQSPSSGPSLAKSRLPCLPRRLPRKGNHFP